MLDMLDNLPICQWVNAIVRCCPRSHAFADWARPAVRGEFELPLDLFSEVGVGEGCAGACG